MKIFKCCLLLLMTSAAMAGPVNPASKEYVDRKFAVIQLEIDALNRLLLN